MSSWYLKRLQRRYDIFICLLALLENAYSGPFLEFWGIWPLSVDRYHDTPKRHVLGRKDAIWRIDRQNQSNGVICYLCRWWRSQKRKTRKETRQWQTDYLHRPPTLSQRQVDLHVWWCPRNSYNVPSFIEIRSTYNRNLTSLIDLAISLYNSLDYSTSHDWLSLSRKWSLLVIQITMVLYAMFVVCFVVDKIGKRDIFTKQDVVPRWLYF